ncbi:hypothetical protein C5B86_05875 [Haloferax sp. Atlit-19N]|uniref:AroM family protein n=1 Tax=Haloferax sp. Atlit-19N TaxID=2077201 RepID=UPI000E287856|nr:AroM family protein [Haloferax sp. Atlit-19N]RDZ48562.1 hypothetical protein C5B86_05875 [Haloferax sp. Atlit-19N]
MSTLGLVTIGQAPRSDVTPDIAAALPPEVDIVEVGALDQFDSAAEVEAAVGPQEGEPVYVSRLVDGTPVTVDRESVVELLRERIRALESEVTAIGVLCTGHFPPFDAGVPVFEPSDLLSAWVSTILDGGTLGVIMPKEEQEAMTFEKWADYDLVTAAGSPYADEDEVSAAAAEIGTDADLIVMDCMGYTPEMKATVREITDTSVLLGRSVLAKTAEEVL